MVKDLQPVQPSLAPQERIKAATSNFTTNLYFFQWTQMKNSVSQLSLTAPTIGEALVTTLTDRGRRSKAQ